MDAREAAAVEHLAERDPMWTVTADVSDHDPDLFASDADARATLEELEERGLVQNVGGPFWRATTVVTSNRGAGVDSSPIGTPPTGHPAVNEHPELRMRGQDDPQRGDLEVTDPG